MPDDGSDYLLEVPYPPQFYREHAPLWLRTVLAANGRRHSAEADPTWCEVGCGSGLGLIVLAATNPSTTFHGIDVNPRHIDDARAFAAAAGIGNVRFHRADIRQADHLPAFDHIVVRGLYSWVAPEIRRAIDQFTASHLRPGGVALIHYLALPGAADFTAFHGLFRAIGLRTGTSARETVRAGLDMIARLREGRAGFFATHPVAERMARQIAADHPDYTAHDYLNDHYAPLSSAEVIHHLHGQGLRFAGSATPFDNLDDFSVPGNLRALCAAQPDIGLREAMKDVAGNQFSRLDLYVRDTAPLPAEARDATPGNLHFRALPGAPRTGGLSFASRIGQVAGDASVFGPVLELFASGDVISDDAVAALPRFAANPASAGVVLQAMMGAGLIHPAPDAPADPEPARRVNALLLERRRAGAVIPALASPALASALFLPPELLDVCAAGQALPAEVQRLLP